jgi:hypothetical protein
MKILFAFLFAATLLPAADWQPLFNGENLNGWVMTGPGRFVVEDGAMKTEGGMGLLYYSRKKFGDCTIRVVFKVMPGRGNSGVVIRLPEKPSGPWYGVHHGYEVQIDAGDDEWHATGAIYSLAKVSSQPQKPVGEWNTMEIVLDGPITRSILNGVPVMEFDPSKKVPDRKKWFEPVRGPRPDSGYIGLQNHDDDSTVYFKEVSVRSGVE